MSTESLTSRPPLPPHWVSKIFRECQGHYGSRWLDMWRTGQTLPDGTDVGLQNAMEKWGERLAGFIDRPEALRKAMQSLPIHPPTLPEFIALCRQQSITLQDSLPPPTPDAIAVAQIRAEAQVNTAQSRDQAAAAQARHRSSRLSSVWSSRMSPVTCTSWKSVVVMVMPPGFQNRAE